MIIIGINAYHADSSAAIFVDGLLVAAIEEERFRRIKHWAGFPQMAIEFCLKEVGVGFRDIDYFAIGRDPKAKFLQKLIFLAKNPSGSINVVRNRWGNSRKVSSLDQELALISGMPASGFTGKTKQVEHHRSHLASAFFASPFEEAACISIDGSGDFTTTMTAIGKGNEFTVLDSLDFPHSLGILYTAFTQLLGFPHYGDEYKVMGMAPYGEPKYFDKMKQVIEWTGDGLFKLNLDYFRKGTDGIISYGKDHIPLVQPMYSGRMIEIFGSPRKSGDPIERYHKDLAASVQKMTEETIFHMLGHLQKQTGLQNVCTAGGVAQNSVVNGKIRARTAFEHIYIPPAGHDAGIAMGAALYVQHQDLKMPRSAPILSAFTGSHFNNKEIREFLLTREMAYTQYEDEFLFEEVVNCLVDGGVVGWFTGRAEFGPRALGARSIIADPRRKDAKELINSKIKRRESFRPFAPSILKEYVAEYFEVNDTVPFMEKVFLIKKNKQSEIPAVTHIDGSGRLQTVDRNISPRYYALIEAFRKKTGVPLLLNTSFNENEPIVNTPGEALDCFLRTEMDMLVMENIILTRSVKIIAQ